MTVSSGEVEPAWSALPIAPDHAQYLADHGVEPHVAAQHGIRSISAVEDLPEEFAHHGDAALPALYYRWTEPDGTVRGQLRVPDRRIQVDGKYAKYLWGKNAAAKLWAARPVQGAARVLIVEGTKQTLAAASYAPADTAVYGIGGCRMWSTDGVPTPHLAVTEGAGVIVVLDADAKTNPDVYDAGDSLAEALTDQGAESVKFMRLAAGKKAGLDDVLGAQPRERRAAVLANMIDKTERAGAKISRPADVKPKASSRRGAAPATDESDDGRPVLPVNGDKLKVIRDLTSALKERWSGTRLFDFGGIPTTRDGARTTPLTKDAFAGLIAETARTVARSGREGDYSDVDTWPDERTLGAVMARPQEFARLERISQVPYLRPDGSVCQQPGYDEGTKTFLVLGDDLADVAVPDEPTAQQLAVARDLLTGELLEGFPFPDDASRAGAIALLLTPFVRGLVPLVPLAVVDGKEAGSGKNLLADVVAIIATGRPAQPLPYTTDDAEQRKVITSAFRSGAEMFVFDEAHKIDGPSFARALTSITYQDRVLGVSNLVEFPNRITWMSLGNQVAIAGDMGRRCYRIAISYPGSSPENRPETDFRHPDLREWTTEHRAQLVSACLTLVRSWFAAGRPRAPIESMGSFEAWQKLLAGILLHAGIPGFMANVKKWRSESDFDAAHWTDHLRWLRDRFGDNRFTTGDVIRALDKDPVAEHPPGLEDTSGKSYPRQLGVAYARMRDRSMDGRTLRKTDETGHGRVTKWAVSGPAEDPFAEPATPGGGSDLNSPPGNSSPAPVDQPADVPAAPVIPSPRPPADATPSVAPGELERGVRDGPGPVPVDFLLHLAVQLPPIECEDCGGFETPVPPAMIVYRCARCHPDTLIRGAP